MTHGVAGIHVSTCGQVPVNQQQLLLITGLKEIVLVHIIRLRDTNTMISALIKSSPSVFMNFNCFLPLSAFYVFLETPSSDCLYETVVVSIKTK